MPHQKRRPENQTENPVKMTGSSPVKEDKKRDKKFTRAKMADKPRRATIMAGLYMWWSGYLVWTGGARRMSGGAGETNRAE